MTITDFSMSTKSFSTRILVDQSPREVFDAINTPRTWWHEGIEGSTDKLDAEFRYQYQDIHHCTMKITEMIPDQKVVWSVLDNFFNFTKDKHEWRGTKISFDISRKGDQTELTFTHEGLTPAYECFDICKNAWTGHIQDDLYNLITTEK